MGTRAACSARCSRCGAAAYCSTECQRKDWKTHKLSCQKVVSPETRVSDLLRAGKLFTAGQELAKLEKPSTRLATEHEERVKDGIHSEVVEGRLELQPVTLGMGYVAAKDMSPGDVLLFDTAFCAAPTNGEKEYFYLIAEKAIRKGHRDRRISARADAQADFYYASVLKLGTKDNHDRATLDDTEMDADMKEQILVCSIAEANCLYCTQDPSQVALFVAGARFNHSCAPNAVFESSRGTLVVKSLAAIPAGEEVTVSYLPSELLSEAGSKRRERLLQGRGFHCRCMRCQEEAGSEGGPP
ncbi:unnamed protein product [Symbiodinium natans]|uniref:Histone-lysine N-methyltransferase SMYD3 n=1 Tax=Symbiodinium natans TaxID=878477 RepID=A0A812U4D8_9DINO|nr:unnamed protein product [Symbiodinium natans]